jgi:hypothetical protein
MASQPPAPWSFAARATYFGDRVCAFCDHHNPAGAKFCNDCASPLHLKPCNKCDAINDHAAITCYKCGAACPPLFNPPGATAVLPAANPGHAWATPGDASTAASVTRPALATSALRAYWRSVRPGQFLSTAIASILIAGAYAAYRSNPVMPDVTEVASQPVNVPEQLAPPATPAVPVTAEPKPAEPETKAALEAPIPATNSAAPKPASTRQRTVPVPAAKRTSAHGRPAPERQTPVGASSRVAHGRPTAPVRVPGAGNRKALPSSQWQAMQVSLARCSGGLFARIVCDQRVRQYFCAGRWGEAPECASFTNEHGQ